MDNIELRKIELRERLERKPIPCPECGKMSDSVKSYDFPEPTFLLIAYNWKTKHHVACAKCMRKRILSSLFSIRQMLKANFSWPIVNLPWLSVNLTRTFVRGHSEDIIDDLQSKRM